MGEQGTGTRPQSISIDLERTMSGSVEVQNDAADPLIPHQQIRTAAKDMDRNLFVMTGHHDADQFVPRARPNEELRRPPHLEPGMLGQQLIPLGDLGEIFE
jgi:hypothetical protein